MTQTFTLPGEVYSKLAQGAAERGMTVEALLTVVSELIVLPNRPTAEDRRRSDRIETLFERAGAGQADAQDTAELDRLIAADYEAANSRADQLYGDCGIALSRITFRTISSRRSART